MQPDDERQLEEAFAELHRRQREQAPSFAGMREEAIRRAERRPATPSRPIDWQRLAWAGAAASVAALAMWSLRPAWEGSSPGTPPQVNHRHRVDELITAIERHVEAADPLAFSEYPTDLLLAGNSGDDLP